jgi:formate dehydrogenase subunit gamma
MSRPDTRLPRFTSAERALHWTTAAVVLTCAITGLILYVGELSTWVGRRELLKDIHVIAGLLMPVPLVLAYAGRWRNAVRADIRRLSRWSRSDRMWLRSFGKRATYEVGKFNAGQKLNAAFILGMIPVMLMTGSVMKWNEPFSDSWRTGATFVHDWTAKITWVVVLGHIAVAISKPPALWSMFTGRMSERFAREHHPAWAEQLNEPTEPSDPTPVTSPT